MSEAVLEIKVPAVTTVTEQAIREAGERNKGIVISDTKSYEGAKRARTEMRTMRTTVEKSVKAITAPLRDKIAEIKTEGDRLIEIARGYEEPLQEEVTRWEEAKAAEKAEAERIERERVAAIDARIAVFTTAHIVPPSAGSHEIRSVLEVVSNAAVDAANYEEFIDRAQAAKDAAIVLLTATLDATVERERQAAELAAERDRLEAERRRIEAEREAERAKQEAEAAERLRVAQELARQEQEKMAAARAELEREKAELAKQKAEAERQRLAEEEAAQAAARAEADRIRAEEEAETRRQIEELAARQAEAFRADLPLLDYAYAALNDVAVVITTRVKLATTDEAKRLLLDAALSVAEAKDRIAVALPVDEQRKIA